MTSNQQERVRQRLDDDDNAKEFVNELSACFSRGVQEENNRLIHRCKLSKDSSEYRQLEKLNKLSRKIFDIIKNPEGDLLTRLEKFGFSSDFKDEILCFIGATGAIQDQVTVKRGAKSKIDEYQITLCAKVMMVWKDYYPNRKISSSDTSIFFEVMGIIFDQNPRQLIERTLKERSLR